MYCKTTSLILLTAAITLVPACSQKSEFQSSNIPSTTIGDNISVEEFCGTKTLQRVKTTLVFPPDTETCAWGENGNLPAGQSISAVQSYTQSIDLGVPVGSICDFFITTNEEFTVYDDDITFTFDQFAFAGDFLHRDWLVGTAELESVGDLLRYDRLKIIGKRIPEGGAQEWLEQGITGDFNTRQNDQTQREGNFNLQLTQDFLNLMPRSDLTRQVHEFGFHIFGNNHDSDCQHQGFEIEVDIGFVPRETL